MRDRPAIHPMDRIEQFYRTLVEATDDAIFVVGRDGRYQMFNERNLKLFGFTPDQIIGRTPREAFGDEVGDRFERNNAAVFADRKPKAIEEWFALAGQTRCYSTALSPILDDAGDVAAVVGIGRDVTDLKRMAEELETYAQEMESIVDRRVRYERFIADLTQEAIKRQPISAFLGKVVERLGQLLEVSRSYLFEYDARRQQMSSTHEWVADGIRPVHEKDRDVPVEAVPWAAGELLAGRIVRFNDVRQAPSPEFVAAQQAQGVLSILIVPVLTFGKPFGGIGFDECLIHRAWEDADVELLQSVGRVVATTVERRCLEQEVLQTERLVATGRLAASIAHEINNPLQGIVLHLDVIRGHIDRKRKRNFAFVMEGFQRIAGIIGRLLDLHRNVKRVAPLDVNRLLEDAVGLVSDQLLLRGCEARWRLDPALPRVMGNVAQMLQVFVNLILNASDSMEQGGTITIATAHEGNEAVIDIEDTGTGIDDANLPHLFEPFFSTKEQAGAGLGLFVSHAVVADHGGRIEVMSRKGMGTTMRISLPIAGREAAPA